MTVRTDPRALRGLLASYQRPSLRRSITELLVTAIPLATLWGGAFYALSQGCWWGVLLTPLAAAFLVRLFMIQHDCGHGAFFATRGANEWVGRDDLASLRELGSQRPIAFNCRPMRRTT